MTPFDVHLEWKVAGRCVGVATVAALLGLGASAPAAARGLKPLEVKRSYREVLTVLAQGEPELALDRLVTFEQNAVGDSQPWRYIDDLWRAKLQVIRDLLEGATPELMRPIVLLHHDAYFRYSEKGRRFLAHHSRTMSSELADVYVARAESPAATAFAGWVMTSFGVALWSPSNIGESADFFFRAKELDPGNDVALEGLAAAYERGGNYIEAIESLDAALMLEPGRPELVLRLALCVLRRGEGELSPALQQLETLTHEPHPAWIRSVAFQELARARVESDQVEEGVATLRSALDELPGDQQLSIELASLLDQQRRRGEAIAVLDQIRVEGWQRESARLIYDFWTPPELEAIRVRLVHDLDSGRVALAASLDTGGNS